jgi:hypothetical protein
MGQPGFMRRDTVLTDRLRAFVREQTGGEDSGWVEFEELLAMGVPIEAIEAVRPKVEDERSQGYHPRFLISAPVDGPVVMQLVTFCFLT